MTHPDSRRATRIAIVPKARTFNEDTPIEAEPSYAVVPLFEWRVHYHGIGRMARPCKTNEPCLMEAM